MIAGVMNRTVEGKKTYSSQNFRHQPFFSWTGSSSNTGSSLKPRNPPARVVLELGATLAIAA
jgi:hypothetical protein